MGGKLEERWLGQILNRNYRIDSLLGKGGQATIFKGEDLLLQETIAVKVFHKTGDAQHLERFKREARHQMKLSHKNIVSTRAIIEEDDQYFIVMEYVDGTDLGHLLSVSEELPRLPLYQIKSIFSDVLDALGHAHEHGVIHRDIKPPNIMLTQDYRVKLADFGLSRQLQDERLTVEGQMLGTPAYTAPEILQGASTLDPRCDIYSVGVSLYEALCGTTPFLNPGEVLAPFELLGRHMFMEPESPAEKGIPISSALNSVVMQSITKDPDARFESCAEFNEALIDSMTDQTQIWVPESIRPPAPQNNNDTTIVLRPNFAAENPLPSSASDSSDTAESSRVSIAQPGGWEHRETMPQVEAIPSFLSGAKKDPPELPEEDHDSEEYHPTVVSVGVSVELDETLNSSVHSGSKGRTSPRKSSGGRWFFIALGALLVWVGAWILFKEHFTSAPPVRRVQVRRAVQQKTHSNQVYPQKIRDVQMVFVASGSFVQGMNRAQKSSTFSPERRVHLRSFWMDAFEVTVRQYRACIRSRGCMASSDMLLAQQPLDAPVVRVSWREARQFCHWMGKHLPTEAQWEKAARSTDGRIYPWGSREPTCELANRCGCSDRPLSVGPKHRSLGRSRYGAFDMSGNVWEWTQDCFARNAYRTLPLRDPVMKGPSSCSSRVLRGGSWKCRHQWGLFSYTRRSSFHKRRKADIGFRCAWTPQ